MFLPIYIKDVIRQIDLSGKGFPEEFALGYWKKDGSYGEKKRCRKRVSASEPKGKVKRDMNSIKREADRARKFQLEGWVDDEGWVKFDVFIALVVKFNGKLIDHKI